MIDLNMEDLKSDDTELTEEVCLNFIHNPVKNKHIHVCKDNGNITKRCGFNDTDDGKQNCPLFKSNVD